MSEESKNPAKLEMPQAVSSQGPVMDLSEAYLRAVVALPEILIGVSSTLESIAQSLDMISLYVERRGVKEEYISQEDLADEEDDGEEQQN